MAAMNPNTHVVKKGDTLSEIADTYRSAYNKAMGTNYSTYKYVDVLAAINGISNPNYIVAGQKIYLIKTAAGSSSSSNSTKKNTNAPRIKQSLGLLANSDNKLYVTWAWDKKYTDNYKVRWEYYTMDGVWFVGEDTTSEYKYHTYDIPANAVKVRFRVQAVATKKKNSTNE